jgi:hypothetical protein
VNCFQKCGFNLNQTNDGEDVRELSIAKNDWGKLKAGISFQEYVSCDDNFVRCEVQTLEQMMPWMKSLHLVCLRSRRGRRKMVEKVNLQQHFCWHGGY